MKKKILAFCGVFVALALSLVIPMSAVSLSYNWIPITGYPNGIYSYPEDWQLPGGDNDKYFTPLTFGLQITTSRDGLITVPVSYTTSFEIVGNDLVYTYDLSGDFLSYPSLYARVFVGFDPRWVDVSSVKMKMNSSSLNVRLGTEQDIAEMMPGGVLGSDYYDIVLSSPSGEQIHAARLRAPLNSGDYCYLQSAAFHPNALIASYTLTVTFEGVAENSSLDSLDVEDVEDLFSALDDASLTPAASVLSRFWNVPYIRFGMIGLGILTLYAFIVRLF